MTKGQRTINCEVSHYLETPGKSRRAVFVELYLKSKLCSGGRYVKVCVDSGGRGSVYSDWSIFFFGSDGLHEGPQLPRYMRTKK